jgi:hypothetical protein
MSTIIKDDNTNPTTNKHDRVVGKRNRHLKFLDNLDGYQVHHDDVDPRGYTVKLTGGEKIGEVEGLLADTRANLVRYVEVEIEDDIINRHSGGRYTEDDKHALVPVGLVAIDASSNSVTLRGLKLDHLVDYPRFNKKNGYTTSYEIDTNDYLSDFHEYGNTYDRDRYSTDTYRGGDQLDDQFYSSGFYTNRERGTL